MQEPTITLSGAWNGLIAVCAGVAAIWGVVKILAEIRKWAGRSDREQDAKLSKLEQHQIAIDKKLDDWKEYYEGLIKHYQKTRDKHDKEIANLNAGQMLLIKSMRTLLEHAKHGNNTKEMNEATHELDEFLYKS